jgi:hypothetical protein
VTPAPERQRKEDGKFEASLIYKVTPCLKKKKKAFTLMAYEVPIMSYTL